MSELTMFDKIWDEHVVCELAPGVDLLHVDRHYLHDLGGGDALGQISAKGYEVRNSNLTFATADHAVETRPGRIGGIAPWADHLIDILRSRSAIARIRMFDVNDQGQGIVHVAGPELGLTLPGTTVVCGDSHTCAHGAFGSIAFGIGASDIQHVLATQALPQRRPKNMKVEFVGDLPVGVGAKDMALALIGQIGTGGATGHAIEFAGPAIDAMGMEDRMTICSLAIEAGAKTGMIVPDETTFAWLHGRRYAPHKQHWERALAFWRSVASEADAKYDAIVTVNCHHLAPHVTWGTSPEHVIRIDERLPMLDQARDEAQRRAWEDAMKYMGFSQGQKLEGTRIDRVFIGSCTNSRITDLRRAARIVEGRKVASHVEGWVVPGSMETKAVAEAEKLDQVFRAAGFQWREPGCSMCGAANGEIVSPGQRCISTTNRNFMGRQGPGSRTHLASPEMAAAAAVAGCIVDARS